MSLIASAGVSAAFAGSADDNNEEGIVVAAADLARKSRRLVAAAESVLEPDIMEREKAVATAAPPMTARASEVTRTMVVCYW